MSLILNYNHARLVGTVSKIEKGRVIISAKRLSEKEDNIIVCFPDKETFPPCDLGDRVVVEGKLRSHRVRVKGNPNKLEIFVAAELFEKTNLTEDENTADITGYVNKTPDLRTTPLGKTITDISVVCQQRVLSNGKLIQDVIPCIAWNNVAEYICSTAKKNFFIKIFGRIEERKYIKDDVEHTVHELSAIASTISIPDNLRDVFDENIFDENLAYESSEQICVDENSKGTEKSPDESQI